MTLISRNFNYKNGTLVNRIDIEIQEWMFEKSHLEGQKSKDRGIMYLVCKSLVLERQTF